jgi:hypothetical protein
VLTAGLKRAGVRADGATATSGGEDGAELGEVALQGLLRASDLLKKPRGRAANEN